MGSAPISAFTPAVRGWFEASFERPTNAQLLGWPAIARGEHTLLLAPTGSGKTLAAFLSALDGIVRDPEPRGMRVLYVSPLKALNHDIERNLRAPVAGIDFPRAPRIAVRSGDTSQKERNAIRRDPPDILITTPESLYLMLTSQAREALATVDTVIVDEIHAVAASKRGSHLMLSLERLERLAGRPVQRIGLSATQRPLDEIARFLGGDRDVTIVDAGASKELDLQVIIPVDDMRELGAAPAAEGEPRVSIWPAMYPRLLELVREHRSTIVFVNSRRSAERVANRLNELAEQPIARAHHGSVAREQRLEVEDMLKRGELPALVATSSLELGIDMGAVDLVVQIESPKSVAAGLQRVGRAGHSVGQASRGRFFPKWRGDLLETAVVTRRMREGAIEQTRVPRQPLDVLAQQIVAMTAMDEWPVDELHALLRRCHPYRELSRPQLDGVLDMLAGRYPSDEFAELRPRIVWDRLAGTVRGREGVRRLAVMSGGTIPDRGLYGVFLHDSGARVGELDEEMVYEARQGEVFQLGATSWRIEQITRDRVLVSHAPGVPGKMPFWKGDAVGRPYELGRAVGEATRLRRFGDLDERAARNLTAYLDDQREATGALPDDRTIVIERFRDEIGDWRICVLSPFGGRVHAPWAMAIERRMSEALGIEVEATWADDGIAIRLPDSDAVPPTGLIMLPADEVEQLVIEQLGSSPLFAARFRENAARALLIPRRRPGQRTPLWQQRLKAHDLQQVAAKYGSFPVVLETYREVLSDVFELPALCDLLGRVGRGEVRVVEVESNRPSPFACSLLFDYIATYMYEGDTPLAERRVQALTLDRALLAELLSAGDLRELLDADAIGEVEDELQRRGRALSADQLHDLLRRAGDLPADDQLAAAQLVRDRRAVEVRFAGRRRLIAAEDAGLYRDGAGAAIPPGLPAAFLEPVPDALRRLVLRHARGHGPFTLAELRLRLGVDPEQVLRELAQEGALIEGAFRPGGSEREWIEPDVLRRVRRRTLARLRQAVEPVEREALARFLPGWHGIGRDLGRGDERLREVISQLGGVALPVPAWEQDVLPLRVPGYRPSLLDAACASGEVVWIGAGEGRVAIHLRDDVPLLQPAVDREREPLDDVAARVVESLEQSGALFFRQLVDRVEEPDRVVLAELWKLVWAGQLTNDAWHPLRSGGRIALRPVPPPSLRRRARPTSTLPAALGRWSLVEPLLEPAPPVRDRVRALAEALLDRHGVLTRAAVMAEGVAGGFSSVYGELRLMEEAGLCQRGYFVEGLGGAQFALPVAVERLRDVREAGRGNGVTAVLSAVDPANPYGAAVAWPDAPRKLARAAGAWVVLVEGRLALYVERSGRGLVQVDAELLEPAIEVLASLVRDGRVKRLAIERIDGEPVAGTEAERLLVAHGFLQAPRRVVLRA
ncbi:MAG: ATP-dependent helicase Lhr and Lhr-like helicase [Gaiellales bacterium]|nr:ATP-dependent helicase Lhr and Lhr-like helicase [Gaiellales bacterium]